MSNKVAVVTGGTSGIGRATALALKDAGCTVYELSRRAQGVEGLHHISADVTREESVRAAVEQIMAREGRIDILVNNAGFGISGAVEFTSTEDAKSLFDVNFFGMVNMNRQVVPIMREAGHGRIVNLSSVAAPVPIPFQTYYSATKAAVNAYTMALASRRPAGRSGRETTSIRAASAAPWPAWSTTRRPAWTPPEPAAMWPEWPCGRGATTRCTPSASTISSSCS